MSSISSLYSPAALYPTYQSGQNSSVAPQTAKNLLGLGNALQSGDLPASQDAMAKLQDGLMGDEKDSDSSDALHVTISFSNGTSSVSSPQTSPTGPFTNNTQANADYQSMVLNLGSGDLAAAAKDYTELQLDLKLHSGSRGGNAVPVPTVDISDSAGTSGSVINITV